MKKVKVPKPYDLTSNIIAYETGQLDKKGIIKLFQHLVDTGQAWHLQGHYGRTANALINAGYVVPSRKKTKDYWGNTIGGLE